MRKQKDDMQVNVAGLRRNIKNLAHNYSEAQVKVREATSNDPWGPSATIMAEIADLTYNVVAFSEIMQMIWKRLNDHGKNWRHVYKALILLEYLIKTGNEKVAAQCRENIYAIQTLRDFIYYEEGKDQGTHVREKAKQLVSLLKDDERLKNERLKAMTAKERFAQHPSGFGSDGYIDGPSQRDMPPGWQEEPKNVSELEMVRPQTAGEEELQLQLAMAMSREEAEQEEAKRRSDDVRLQLALSQSEQDFKTQTKKEEPQSHLMDLLDIALDGTNISIPPLAGAIGGVPADPWTAPQRAASQLSDPWSGTSSPQIDPWQPAMNRAATASAPLGVGAGVNMNPDGWGLRTQSPSVASGSSTEGWLNSNGGNPNSNNPSAVATVDPWLSKTSVVPVATASPAIAANPGSSWLGNTAKSATNASTSSDPWAPKLAPSNGSDDPWKNMEGTGAVPKKPSPDMDEFDIITNRKKTGDLLTTSPNGSANNNNVASLLDELDPLSAMNSESPIGSLAMSNTKKPLKTPQAFLGENSSLVNLDNLIKPNIPQTQVGNAAYNPFSDTALPQPKTNLFQQQPAMPSINQLKQQQPFPMTINQDPWAPVVNTNVTPQQTKTSSSNLAREYTYDDLSSEAFEVFSSEIINPFDRDNNNDNNNNVNNNNNKNINNIGNGKTKSNIISDNEYDIFDTSLISINSTYLNQNNACKQLNLKNNNNNCARNYSESLDNIWVLAPGFENNNTASIQYNPQNFSKSQNPLTPTMISSDFSKQQTKNSSILSKAPEKGNNLINTFSASLASTPGISIIPYDICDIPSYSLNMSGSASFPNDDRPFNPSMEAWTLK